MLLYTEAHPFQLLHIMHQSYLSVEESVTALNNSTSQADFSVDDAG